MVNEQMEFSSSNGPPVQRMETLMPKMTHSKNVGFLLQALSVAASSTCNIIYHVSLASQILVCDLKL